MLVVRNLQENRKGVIDCQLLLNGRWVDHKMPIGAEYEIHESSEWPDIKPCLQSEKDAHEQELIDRNSKSYLSSTDWYVMRAMDSGEPIPDDVKKKRAEARAAIK